MRSAQIIIALLIAVSCTPPQRHLRERYVNDNPELKNEIRKAILRGDVIVGMTKEQVYASWATPIYKQEVTEKQTTYEVWTYPDLKDSPFVNLYFLGDFVVKIEKLDHQPEMD